MYSIYVNYTNTITRYHTKGCGRIQDRRTRNGYWEHDLPDLDTVFMRGFKPSEILAVVPARCCLPNSTDARCIGCR